MENEIECKLIINKDLYRLKYKMDQEEKEIIIQM